MGFQTTAITTTLTAKLTPIGRQKLISNDNTFITKFAVGDSDANYNISDRLVSGFIPSNSGDLSNNGTSTSTFTGVDISDFVNVDANGNVFKSVEANSTTITTSTVALGITTISGDTMSQLLLNRKNSSDRFNNLFKTFKLPLNGTDKTTYTGTTYANNGFSNTALSGLTYDDVLLISTPNANYGELLDGKTVKLYLETVTGTTTAFTIYSAFENTGISTAVQDGSLIERSSEASQFGTNYAFLFSDEIQKPNSASTKSWATGYNTPKPYSVYNKEQFNLLTDANNSLVADKAVGIAYLDKGFIVITEPTMVNNFYDVSGNTMQSATTLTYDSVASEVSQQFTCILDRGEFSTSTNSTFGSGDIVRISEIGLYDDENDLIAIAKTDRHIIKQTTELLSFGIKISV